MAAHANPGYSARGFWSLNLTQFQGAFSDNVFKTIVLFLVPTLVVSEKDSATSTASFIFTIPFLLFPGYAGYLADRFSKHLVTRWTKYWELLVMLLGLIAFYYNNVSLIWITLFLMARQSAVFSPT
jgi:acyl-[acyl-carrier-protein]-phospholipid O-acyltransferase/long-chain-fatty-acid--[acyl-carrier-protein] ligase